MAIRRKANETLSDAALPARHQRVHLPHKKQNGFGSFSCWHGCRIDVEAQSGGATLEGGDVPLALLFFVALLSLVNEVFAAGQHEVHHACELVCRGSVGAGLVHSAAQATIKCTECGVAA